MPQYQKQDPESPEQIMEIKAPIRKSYESLAFSKDEEQEFEHAVF
jgi:hypothetical protein